MCTLSAILRLVLSANYLGMALLQEYESRIVEQLIEGRAVVLVLEPEIAEFERVGMQSAP